MSNIGSYEERLKNFDWKLSEQELEFGKDGRYNIGWFCSDRICDKGLGKKLALIWEGFTGEVKKYTYEDIRAYSNTTAKFLQGQGLKPGDRVCLFMDKVPELYICFLGILKMGCIAQPLFSAFGEEALFTRLDDAKTAAVLEDHHRGRRRRQAAQPGRGLLRHGEAAAGGEIRVA
jgi:acetyl-CoA synthetase